MVKQERAVRTRETLIRCAAEAFDREGFSVASLSSISRRASVSNGALHFHFESKVALADTVEREALTRLQAITDMGPPVGTGQVQLLMDATQRLTGALRQDVVLRAGFALNGETARLVRVDLREHWRRWVGETVARAEAEGELSPGVAALDVVTAVVAVTAGLEVLGVRDAEWLSPATVGRFWRLMLPTFTPRAAVRGIEAGGARPP